MALVWHDDLQQIIPHATRLEEKLLFIGKLGFSINVEGSIDVFVAGLGYRCFAVQSTFTFRDEHST